MKIIEYNVNTYLNKKIMKIHAGTISYYIFPTIRSYNYIVD